ncbi:hypothetical protein NDU88_000475, partial [Pleurodeles waltl]
GEIGEGLCVWRKGRDCVSGGRSSQRGETGEGLCLEEGALKGGKLERDCFSGGRSSQRGEIGEGLFVWRKEPSKGGDGEGLRVWRKALSKEGNWRGIVCLVEGALKGGRLGRDCVSGGRSSQGRHIREGLCVWR